MTFNIQHSKIPEAPFFKQQELNVNFKVTQHELSQKFTLICN